MLSEATIVPQPVSGKCLDRRVTKWSLAIDRLDGAYADSTLRAYRADFASFSDWCLATARESLPASPETVAAFIAHDAVKSSPATLRRRLAGIRKVHRLLRLESPVDDEDVAIDASRVANETPATEASPRTDARTPRSTHCIVCRYSDGQTRLRPHRRRIRHAVPAFGIGFAEKGRSFGARKRRHVDPGSTREERSFRRWPIRVSDAADGATPRQLAGCGGNQRGVFVSTDHRKLDWAGSPASLFDQSHLEGGRQEGWARPDCGCGSFRPLDARRRRSGSHD